MPSLSSSAAWPVEAPFYAVLVVGALYRLGGRRLVSTRRRVERPARAASFYLGLLVILAALDSPLDSAADTLFAAHMAQHVLLLTVAPPLIVLAAPWTRIWQPLPLRFRRVVARAVVVSPRGRPLRAVAHALGRPLVAWLLFDVNLLVWHLPSLYDLTLRNQAVHDVEHALFLFSGVLFWAQVVDSPPFRVRLDWLRRVVYTSAAMLVGWILALVLAFEPKPLYPAYAALSTRPGGISALADQQVAAGVMWVPGSIAFTVAIIVFFYRWLAPEPQTRLAVAGGR
ncbi:MAG: cytochrome c oxidase assembly protein [Gaiellaceae bacterium]